MSSRPRILAPATALVIAVALFVACASEPEGSGTSGNDSGWGSSGPSTTWNQASDDGSDRARAHSDGDEGDLVVQPRSNAWSSEWDTADPDEPQVTAEENDRRIRRDVERAMRDWAAAEYERALDRLEELVDLEPRSDDVGSELAQALARVRAYHGAFEGVMEKGVNPSLVQLFFQAGGTVVGLLIKQDNDAGTILIKPTESNVGFQMFDLDSIAEVRQVSGDRQRRAQHEEYETKQYHFQQRRRIDADDWLEFARTAWAYGEREDAHAALTSALEMDPDMADTVMLEADPDYTRFQRAQSTGNADRAGELLEELGARYPNAAIFRDARQSLGRSALVEAVSQPVSGTPATPRADDAVDDDVAEQVLRRLDRESDEADEATREDEAVERGANSELGRELQGSVREMIASGNDHLEQARRYDAESLPGMDNADVKLQQAIYQYRCAQSLFREAIDRGADESELEARLLECNRGLFWCRKRSSGA